MVKNISLFEWGSSLECYILFGGIKPRFGGKLPFNQAVGRFFCFGESFVVLVLFYADTVISFFPFFECFFSFLLPCCKGFSY